MKKLIIPLFILLLSCHYKDDVQSELKPSSSFLTLDSLFIPPKWDTVTMDTIFLCSDYDSLAVNFGDTTFIILIDSTKPYIVFQFELY